MTELGFPTIDFEPNNPGSEDGSWTVKASAMLDLLAKLQEYLELNRAMYTAVTLPSSVNDEAVLSILLRIAPDEVDPEDPASPLLAWAVLEAGDGRLIYPTTLR